MRSERQSAFSIPCEASLSATIIRADGTVDERGTISRKMFGISNYPKILTLSMFLVLALLIVVIVGVLIFHWSIPQAFFLLPMAGLVTTAGVNYMAVDFTAGLASPRISAFNYHDSGTGTIAAAIGDVALQTQAGPTTRATGTQSNPASGQYRSIGTISYVSGLAITEWGLFNQAAQGGTLWDHRIFGAMNVVSGDSIQFTYTLTVNAGGS